MLEKMVMIQQRRETGGNCGQADSGGDTGDCRVFHFCAGKCIIVIMHGKQRKIMPVIHNQYYLFVCALAVIPDGLVWADNEDAIARCAKIVSVSDQVLCLQDALRGGLPSSDKAPDARISSTAEPIVVDPHAAIGPIVEADSVSVAPAPTQDVAKPTVGDVAPESSSAVAASSTGPPANELGAEHVTERNDSDTRTVPRVNANIISFQVVGSGSVRLWLDNDQVWQQTGDDNMNLSRKLRRADIVPVEMWRSPFGGYRMRIKSINRTVRVKRVK